jgi:hypothetical protein
MTELCAPAMNVFNKSADLTAMLDQTGVVLPLTPASGQSGCLCFALGMITGAQGNICVWLDPGAVPQVWWSVITDHFDASTFQPGMKSLPQCADVNLPALSSSIYAHLPPLITLVTVIAGGSRTIIVPGSPTAAAGSPADGNASSSSGSAVAIVGIVVGAVIFLAIIAAVACYFIKRDRSLRTRLRPPRPGPQPPFDQPSYPRSSSILPSVGKPPPYDTARPTNGHGGSGPRIW